MDIPYSEIIKTAERISRGRTFSETIKISLLFLVILGMYICIYVNLRESSVIFNNLKITTYWILLLLLLSSFYASVLLLTIKDFFMNNRAYVWDHKYFLKDWVFQGSIVVDRDGQQDVLKIKTSEIGAVIKNRSWRNFTLTFDFKIPTKISYGDPPNENQLERGFGIIYRAKDLNQYYMLKVDKTGYLPHIKNYQYWENNGPTVTTKKLGPSILDSWVNVKLVMKNDILFIKIGSDEFNLYLPTHSIVSRENFPTRKDSEGEFKPNPYASIKYYSGTVGFRSYPLEEVYIKNLQVVSNHILFKIGRKVKNYFNNKGRK